MNQAEHEFLSQLDKTLWAAADKLWPVMDAAVYKHVVLGMIFLKYASDAFEDRRLELARKFRDPNDDYFMDPADYGLTVEDEIDRELENRDYYKEVNVFWVPEEARWQNLRDCCKMPVGDELPWGKKMRGVSLLLDDALAALGAQNKKLENVLAKDTFTKYEVPGDVLSALIDLFSQTNFSNPEWNGERLNLKSKDILGHVYEYFLGQFAILEGKKGGQYYTPKSIVTLIVKMLRPQRGRVFDPAMGSGGFFVQSEEFVEEVGGRLGELSVYGQESNPTTWRLAAMNMAIRGIDFNFGEGPANSFSNDQHPDLRADYVMANPPFNMPGWKDGVKEDDPRWIYGVPPANNANFAWIQHMLYHLAPNGSLALLLANGSMASNTSGEGEIRKRLVEADVIECMLALPGQMFVNAQIPACIWFLTKNKAGGPGRRDRRGEILFIDARHKGYMKDRTMRDFTPQDLDDVASTFHRWQNGGPYEDVPGYCKSATLQEIAKHDYVLAPGRYVGARDAAEDDEPFPARMARLTSTLSEQMASANDLDKAIRLNLASLGWALPTSGDPQC